jgi:DNA-binding response OmpR family regulator
MVASQKPRILVVEDEPLIAIELEDFLIDHGWECLGPVRDLATAPRYAETQPMDAAILNLILDGKNAYPVAAAGRLQVPGEGLDQRQPGG